ncbi:MAG: ribosome recycling factor [Segetibacter sp.]
MTEELELIYEDAEDSMKKAIGFLEVELAKIRAGKANPTMLDGIMVDYYGSPTPINQVANINIMDARTISIQPWEKRCCSQLREEL